jgi:hypothetical protein
VLVRSQVIGFKKIKFFTNENVGDGKLELPENEMHTTAFWITLEPAARRICRLRFRRRQSGIFGLLYALESMATLLLMCDRRDWHRRSVNGPRVAGVAAEWQEYNAATLDRLEDEGISSSPICISMTPILEASDSASRLLLALAERMAERRVLVTFNGKSFDWPLLETRFRMTRSIKPKLPIAHIDLLHPARHLWRPRLGSVRLCELERQVLGFERGFDVASDLIPQAYFDFLRGESPELLAHVFRHNQMDLCGLAALACRMFTLLAEPETSRIDSLELFGVSRLFDRRGQAARARTLYSAALEGGLPRVLDRSARQRLAGLAKRDRDYTLAQTLWHELRGPSPEGLCAYEELAMYFEHKAREPERAAAVAEEALADLRIAHRTRLIATAAYRDWQARFHRRLERVRRKAGLALRNPMLAESSEIAAESK